MVDFCITKTTQILVVDRRKVERGVPALVAQSSPVAVKFPDFEDPGLAILLYCNIPGKVSDSKTPEHEVKDEPETISKLIPVRAILRE